jgi:16S rRNA (cytosine967-C5)-methyltransferase
VVDFCAGAGGKTLALGAAMRGSGQLYALDASAHRLDRLKPRLARSGLSNVYTMQLADDHDDRLRRLAGKADRVLVDAPCSGLGTLRRNPDLKWRQTPSAVTAFGLRQRSILAAAAALVKPGGRLVYATCSLLEEENEAVAQAFVASHPQFSSLPAEPVLRSARVASATSLVHRGQLRLWPQRHSTDAFFAALWQRR